MTVCAVQWCHNSSEKHKKLHNITFHLFPHDPVIAARWTEKLRLSRHDPSWKPTKSTRICCVHFDEKDLYTTERGLRRIRRNAIPTKHLHSACRDEHQGNSFDGIRENAQLESAKMPHERAETMNLGTTTIIKQETIEEPTSENTNLNFVVCKVEEPDPLSNEISENATLNTHLQVVCKKEKPETSSDEMSENLNGHLQIVISEDNQLSDEKRENAILSDPFLGATNHNAKLVQSPTSSLLEHSEDNDDLDSIYDTPQEDLLKRKLKKKTLLQIKHGRVIKTLQQKIRRLQKKNQTLKLIVKTLRKKKIDGSDISRIMAENTSNSEGEES